MRISVAQGVHQLIRSCLGNQQIPRKSGGFPVGKISGCVEVLSEIDNQNLSRKTWNGWSHLVHHLIFNVTSCNVNSICTWTYLMMAESGSMHLSQILLSQSHKSAKMLANRMEHVMIHGTFMEHSWNIHGTFMEHAPDSYHQWPGAFLCCPLGEIKYITSGTAGSLVITETADEDEPPWAFWA